jgi:hypothetical protein
MKQTLNKTLMCLLLFILLIGQKAKAQINLHIEDLPRFYQAFDKVITSSDSAVQAQYINTYYLGKASKGLLEFMKLRDLDTESLRQAILKEKAMLIEKRPWILSVLKQQAVIEKKIERFKKLYQDFREGDIYFLVGKNNTGGTINDKTVYIGAEVLAFNKENWAISTVLHEFTHTQQWTQRNILRLKANDSLIKDYMATHTQLLGRCIEEGMADFVAELVNEESLAKTSPEGHTAFGLKNEKEIWEAFKKEMFLNVNGANGLMGWLYNGLKKINEEEKKDLGYFIGHQICKSYYNKSKNKEQALKEMLATNLTDENSKAFLINSGYLSEKELSEIKK